MPIEPSQKDTPLLGFCVGGYRSFGDTQRIGPLAKINLFAGPNNAGKSNILRFVAKHLQNALQQIAANSEFQRLTDPDEHLPSNRRTANPPFECGIAVQDFPSGVGAVKNHLGNSPDEWVISDINKFLAHESLRDQGSNLSYVTFTEVNGHWFLSTAAEDKLAVANVHTLNQWLQVAKELRLPLPLESWRGALEPVLRHIFKHIPKLPTIHTISAKREIKAEGQEPTERLHDGSGIIARLKRLQNPVLKSRERDLALFQGINTFVRVVTEDPNAAIEIPFEENVIHVTLHGRTLRLEDLGTGIHEVIILAIASTVIVDSIICMEEPEIHLHPHLQRKLIRYLADKTSNQYLIATHSAHLLDMPEAVIFRVELENGQTVVTNASTAGDRWSICQDLGYRASDIVQSNCVVWVEGPSDRTYLLRWLKERAPDLKEHVDYSIMFYGGRLLSHLSASDEEVEEFIQLRRLNRNVALLIDSDKESDQDAVNDTKARIVEELKNGGLVWVTAGREVENYVDPAGMAAAIKAVHKSSQAPADFGQYAKILDPDVLGLKPDKVKIAHKVSTPASDDFSRFDLKERIDELARLIRNANGQIAAAIATGETAAS